MLHTSNSLLQVSVTAVGFKKSGVMLASANISVEKSLVYAMLFDVYIFKVNLKFLSIL